jgi:hypothetical protein
VQQLLAISEPISEAGYIEHFGVTINCAGSGELDGWKICALACESGISVGGKLSGIGGMMILANKALG